MPFPKDLEGGDDLDDMPPLEKAPEKADRALSGQTVSGSESGDFVRRGGVETVVDPEMNPPDPFLGDGRVSSRFPLSKNRNR